MGGVSGGGIGLRGQLLIQRNLRISIVMLRSQQHAFTYQPEVIEWCKLKGVLCGFILLMSIKLEANSS
jgi:hypothetical protein